jgi:ABC-type transport system involved in multi-copper enzyme maturation permease subunit
MISVIRKEFTYAIRSGRFTLLVAGFLFFALLAPLMLKVVLPYVLASQVPGGVSTDMAHMMNMTQVEVVQSYMGDVFEIGTLIVSFTLCGLMASEIRDNTLVFSLCAGKRFGWLLGAKLMVFGTVLTIVTLISLIADYLYAGMLYGFALGMVPILYGGVLQAVYFWFLLACLLFWGTMMQKPIAAGFMTLATGYGIHFIGGLLDIQTWTPSGLLLAANRLEPILDLPLIRSLGITLAVCVFLVGAAHFRLKRMEWNTRTMA